MEYSLEKLKELYYTPFVFKQPRKYYIKDPNELKDVANEIVRFSGRQSEYRKLKDYYDNITKINTRVYEDKTKPNNKLSHPFAEVIVNTETSYFMGIPLQVKPDKASRNKELDRVHILNDSDDVNSELSRLCSIYGHAFEIHWTDTLPDGSTIPRYKAISPVNCMMFHSMEISEEPIAAVVWVLRKDAATNQDYYSATLYTETEATKFEFNLSDKGSIEFRFNATPKPHAVGFLPVIEYVNNEDRTSSFEKVISLIDAYNSAESDTANDMEYWADSYLMLKNLSGTDPEDLAQARRNRVFLVDGDGDASFLNKQTNDRHIENYKDRLTSDIHKFAQVPNLHDEQFATNLSGTAIRMKIKDLEDKVARKEKKFTASLRKRYEIIFSHFDKVNLDVTTDFVDFIYTRNIPSNLVEIADMVAKAPEGLWSNETLRTLYPIPYNEAEEVKRIKKQQEDEANMMSTVDPFKAVEAPKKDPAVAPEEHPQGSNQSPNGQAPAKK